MESVRHNGRIVGLIDGRTFVRKADPERHMLRMPLAWCHDDALLDRLQAAGITGVRIEAKDGTGAWFAPIEVIRSKGFPVNRPGWPPQTGLLLADWASLAVEVVTVEEGLRRLQVAEA